MPSKSSFYRISQIDTEAEHLIRRGRVVMHSKERYHLFIALLASVSFYCVSSFQPSFRNPLLLNTFSYIRKEKHNIIKFDNVVWSGKLHEKYEEDYDEPPAPAALFDEDMNFSLDELELLTVNQLKQQLRLRGLKIGGKKSELIDRLMGKKRAPESHYNHGNSDDDESESTFNSKKGSKSKAQEFAKSRGKELIDVSEYLDEDDIGKETKSSLKNEDLSDDDQYSNKSDSPETWGEEAKIVDDFEGRSIIVDNLSRTIVEFRGSQKTAARAYVVASKDSLQRYLAGGNRTNNSTDLSTTVKNIQLAREKASKVPMRLEDVQGEDVDDEEGLYTQILDRDYGDYGKMIILFFVQSL